MKLQVGVKALIRNDTGSYLLLKRAQPLADGNGIRWDIPGGRLTPGEQTYEALEREIKEETGLTTTGMPHLLTAQDIIVPEAEVHVVRLTYTVLAHGSVSLSDEHDEYTWVSVQDALALPTDPYLQHVFKALG